MRIGKQFQKFDTNNIFMLSIDDFQKCLSSDTTFSEMMKYNKKLNTNGDDKKLALRIFNSLDLNKDDFLNFFDYLKLRNYNKIYNVLLEKEGEVYYENFPIAVHLFSKNV